MAKAVLGESPTNDSLCPSAPGRPGESVLIGVVTGKPGSPRVTPTDLPLEVTAELLALAGPVSASEVFRFASHCRGAACVHFFGNACQLAVRGAALLPEVTADVPKCAIRPRCRWFRQEGIAICKRCPQIVTEQYAPSPEMLRVVLGGAAGSRQSSDPATAASVAAGCQRQCGTELNGPLAKGDAGSNARPV
jgi:hypothetical protein